MIGSLAYELIEYSYMHTHPLTHHTPATCTGRQNAQGNSKAIPNLSEINTTTNKI